MEEWLRLGPSERVPGRPFTDPAHTAADLAAIRTMAARLRALLEEPMDARIIDGREPDGRQHRVVLGAADRLGAGRDLEFVGFFALKRAGLDHAALTRTDDELIEELPGHPGILSYSSLEFPDGNWGNLIVLDPPEAGEHWRTSAKHAWAASELAPRHYTVVRLHNGRLPDGLRSGRDPVLTRTRYHDFRGPTPWRAVRVLRPESLRSSFIASAQGRKTYTTAAATRSTIEAIASGNKRSVRVGGSGSARSRDAG
jgi:hypothetical protein